MVWLLRHGETDLNRFDIKYGALDVPLNTFGIRQAWEIDLPAAATVYSSPLLRAKQTAEIISTRLRLGPPAIDRRLRERSFGLGEGLTDESIALLYPDGTPGMETIESAAARARPLVDSLPADSIVVTHAGVMKGLTGRAHISNGQLVRHHPEHAR